MKKLVTLPQQAVLVFAVSLLLVGLISMFRSPIGFVADFNHNAHGVINSCSLSGSTTTIHGWAHDPDTPTSSTNPTVTIKVGSLSVTAKTSIAGYHDAAINKYLDANYPNAPKGDTYGFTASFSTLYKGTAYAVSGIANNSGSAGSNTNMAVDTTASQPDGISVSSLFTSSKTLPDACLVTKPAPPPAPTPTPTPAPTPTPTHATSSGSSSSTPKNSAVPTVNSPADANVAGGTVAVLVTAPADGAPTVLMQYGTSATNFDSITDPIDASSGNVTIELDTLQPKTQYFYQIIRQDAAGNRGISPTATFTTAGYNVTLHFIDAKGKTVSGISGAIDDTKNTSSKSDKNGNLTFANLDPGQYKVTFKVGKLNHTKSFDTETASGDGTPAGKVIELKDTVNVSTLTGGTTAGYTGPAHHNRWPLVLLILFLLGAGTAAFFWFRRHKAGSGFLPPSSDYALSTLPSASSPIPPVKPPKKIKQSKKEESAVPLQHVGESLPDMVLKAMHEEAQKRQTKD